MLNMVLTVPLINWLVQTDAGSNGIGITLNGFFRYSIATGGCLWSRNSPFSFCCRAASQVACARDLPPDELNHASRPGIHFGYPYCHGKTLADDEFGSKRACGEFIPAAMELGPHVASLGMRFYTGMTFPESYRRIEK